MLNGHLIGAFMAMVLATGCLGSSVCAALMSVQHKSDFLACFAFVMAIGAGIFGTIAVVAACNQ